MLCMAGRIILAPVVFGFCLEIRLEIRTPIRTPIVASYFGRATAGKQLQLSARGERDESQVCFNCLQFPWIDDHSSFTSLIKTKFVTNHLSEVAGVTSGPSNVVAKKSAMATRRPGRFR